MTECETVEDKHFAAQDDISGQEAGDEPENVEDINVNPAPQIIHRRVHDRAEVGDPGAAVDPNLTGLIREVVGNDGDFLREANNVREYDDGSISAIQLTIRLLIAFLVLWLGTVIVLKGFKILNGKLG